MKKNDQEPSETKNKQPEQVEPKANVLKKSMSNPQEVHQYQQFYDPAQYVRQQSMIVQRQQSQAPIFNGQNQIFDAQSQGTTAYFRQQSVVDQQDKAQTKDPKLAKNPSEDMPKQSSQQEAAAAMYQQYPYPPYMYPQGMHMPPHGMAPPGMPGMPAHGMHPHPRMMGAGGPPPPHMMQHPQAFQQYQYNQMMMVNPSIYYNVYAQQQNQQQEPHPTDPNHPQHPHNFYRNMPPEQAMYLAAQQQRQAGGPQMDMHQYQEMQKQMMQHQKKQQQTQQQHQQHLQQQHQEPPQYQQNVKKSVNPKKEDTPPKDQNKSSPTTEYQDQQSEVQDQKATEQKKKEEEALEKKKETKYMHKEDPNIVRPIIPSRIKGKAQFECKDGLITVDTRYDVTRCVGSGAYGHVFAAKDSKNNKQVAIKRIHKAFEDVIDAKRVLREIKILKFFDHENIIELIDIQRPPGPVGYNDVYIITQLMEADLHQLIYSKQKLETDHYQYFMYQILRGLFYMHSANIMHRDLKPSNILINLDCYLKICDFGLSRGFGEVDEYLKKTAYVVTRWYRAPEVSLLIKSYNQSLDMWSVGCIFAELLQRTALFPGDTNINQVLMVLQIVGFPSDEDLEFIDNEQALAFIQRQRKRELEQGRKQVDWSKRIPHASELELDLLRKLLAFSPEKRITVSEALDHPYFEKLRKYDNLPKCTKVFDWSWEHDTKTGLGQMGQSIKLDKELISTLIYNESLSFHPDEEQDQEEEDQEPAVALGIQEQKQAEPKETIEMKPQDPPKQEQQIVSETKKQEVQEAPKQVVKEQTVEAYQETPIAQLPLAEALKKDEPKEQKAAPVDANAPAETQEDAKNRMLKKRSNKDRDDLQIVQNRNPEQPDEQKVETPRVEKHVKTQGEQKQEDQN